MASSARLSLPSSSLLANVSRALRHHRKRLAKIVVDQWLYKARARLFALRLLKVYQKHWKVSYLKAWKKFTCSNKHWHKKQEDARNYNTRLKKKRCFNAWSTMYKLENKRRDTFLKISELIRSRICSGFFCLWHRQSQQQLHYQKKLLVADQCWKLTLLSTHFMHWQLGVQLSMRKKQLKKLALGFWAHWKLNRSLLAFKKAVDQRHRILTMNSKRSKRIIEALFKHWHSSAHKNMKDLQEKALCAFCTSLLSKSLRTLQNYVSRKSSSKCINHIAFCFRQDQCMSCTYKAWHSYVAIRENKRLLKAAALTHLKTKLMRLVFIKWHLYTQCKKRQDSIRRGYKEKLCSRCLQIWKELVFSNRTDSCTNDFKNESSCRLSLVVTLLQSQNKLLRRGFLQIIRNKRLSVKRRIKTLVISRACCLYRRCIQELASAARNYMKNSKGKSCHACTENTLHNEGKVVKIEQALASECNLATREETFKRYNVLCPNVGRDCHAPSLLEPTVQPSLQSEGSALFQAISNINYCAERKAASEKLPRINEVRGTLERFSGRLTRKTRLPPRRPAYLADPFVSERRASDSKLIEDELVWTEDLVCSYDKLKEEVHHKEAELAALHERLKAGDQMKKYNSSRTKLQFYKGGTRLFCPWSKTLQAGRIRSGDAVARKEEATLHLD